MECDGKGGAKDIMSYFLQHDNETFRKRIS